MATRAKSVTLENLTVLSDDGDPRVRLELRLLYTETDQVEVEGEPVDVTTNLIDTLKKVETPLTVAGLTVSLEEAKDQMQADINLYKRAEILAGKAILSSKIAALEAALEV